MVFDVFFVGVPSLFFGAGISFSLWLRSSSIFLFFPAIAVLLTSLLGLLPPETGSEADVCGIVPFTTVLLCSGIEGETLLLDGKPVALFSVVGASMVLS